MPNPPPTCRREVVALFSSRDAVMSAIEALLAAGFQRPDLSLLASHDSIDAAAPDPGWRARLVALVDELRYEGPLVTAGLIAVAAGPVGALISGLIAAGIGGAALKDLMEKITARPHADEFARAVTAGSIILWVDVQDGAHEALAGKIMTQCGGVNVHTNLRPV